MGKKIKEMKQISQKIWETKFGEKKNSVIEIWDINCRNEFTGGTLRE